MRYALSEESARKLKGVLAGGFASTASENLPPVAREVQAFPVAFTLRWAQSLNSGEGAWIVWLTEDALMFAGATVAIANANTAAQGYPAGWYRVPSAVLAASGGTLWLVLSVSESNGVTTATANFAASASHGEGDTSIPVAYATRDTAPNSATFGKVTVKQNLYGALVYGGGDGAPSPKPFDIDESSVKVVRCKFHWNGALQTLPDFTIGGARAVYLNATGTASATGTAWSFALSGTAATGNLVQSYKLYDLDGSGGVECDYRDTFLALSENPSEFSLSGMATFIADMRYNTTSHQLQKLVGTIDADGTVTMPDAAVDANWTMITNGQATPLAATEES